MQVPESIFRLKLNCLFKLLCRLRVHTAQRITTAHAIYRKIVIFVLQIGAPEMFFSAVEIAL